MDRKDLQQIGVARTEPGARPSSNGNEKLRKYVGGVTKVRRVAVGEYVFEDA
jgi:hypothetical protein